MANRQTARKVLIPVVIAAMLGTAGMMVAALSATVTIGTDFGSKGASLGRDIARAVKGLGSLEKTKQVTNELSATGFKALRIDTAGAVSVRPGSDDKIRVVATVHGFGADEAEALRMIEAYHWTLANRGETAEITIDKPKQHAIRINGKAFGASAYADFAIEVPARLHVTVTTDDGDARVTGIGGAVIESDNGAIDARDLSGDLMATSDNGAISVHRIKGEATLKSDNGNIVAQGIGGGLVAASDNGAIEVERIAKAAELITENGRIRASHIGGELVATSGNGSITASDLGRGGNLRSDNGRISGTAINGPRLTVQTETGSIQLKQPAVSETEYDLSTEHGRIEVSLSPKSSLAVTLQSDHGRVSSDLPLMKRAGGENALSGVLNQGRHKLKATSETGSIALKHV